MTIQMIDPTGPVVLELRAAAATWPAPLAGYNIDAAAIAPEHQTKDGSAPLVVVVRRGPPARRRRIPIADFLFTIDCYHPDARIASQIAGLVSDVFHDRGARMAGQAGLRRGLFNSADIGQSGSLVEPGTGWPLERVTVQVTAATEVLA